MNIIDVKLQFKSLGYGNKPQTIVLHHAAMNGTVEDIHELHQNKGWAGIGYHYYVRKDGTIYKGRPENAVGAHCPTVNAKSISICAEGNFEVEQMSETQKNAIIELCRDIRARYNNIKDIKGHRELKATACPGTNYPLDEIKQSVLQSEVKTESKITNDVLKLQQVLNRLKIRDAKGNALAEDGILGSCTKEAVKRFQSICGLAVDGIAGTNTWNAINSILKKPLTKIGDRGIVVRYLQYRVGASIDGIFGWGTNRKVAIFQGQNNLKQDGIVGLKTWAELIG